MNETIKFVNNGRGYAEDDTGTIVGFGGYHGDQIVAIVRLTEGNYVTAPLGDIVFDEDSVTK